MLKLKQLFTGTDGLHLGPFAAIVGGVGLVLVLLGLITVWTTGWGKDLFAPGATLMTVALTAYGASQGVVRWTEQRRRDRETAEFKRREEVYAQISAFMLQRFGSRKRTNEELAADKDKDAVLRTQAALWASPGTVHMLAYWQSLLSKFNGDLTEQQSNLLKQSLGRALTEMRSDLAWDPDLSHVERHVILKSIFND